MAGVNHHYLLMVMIVLLVQHVLYITAESQSWYKVHLSNTFLNEVTSRGERNVRSVAQCTMLASIDPRDQLVCFRTPDVCTRYDVLVKAQSDEEEGKPCWTRHLSLPTTTTTIPNPTPISISTTFIMTTTTSIPIPTSTASTMTTTTPIPEGESILNDNCTISQMINGTLQLYQGTSGHRTPNIAFSSLMDKNCIHLKSTTNNWDDARTSCWNLGGDLFVPGDFTGMMEYIKKIGHHVIMGIKTPAHNWLDGRPVEQQELQNPTHNEEECFYVDEKLLHTHKCDKIASVLCQKGVRYPDKY